MRAPLSGPHLNLITSQRLHLLLIPLRIQNMNFKETQHSIHNTSRAYDKDSFTSDLLKKCTLERGWRKQYRAKNKLSKKMVQLNMSCTLTPQKDRNRKLHQRMGHILRQVGLLHPVSVGQSVNQSASQLQACEGKSDFSGEVASIRPKAIFWKSRQLWDIRSSDCSWGIVGKWTNSIGGES